jgi:NAD(P)-dependent dehydrogenase (short-subunit alcohol dehydrogenase family)
MKILLTGGSGGLGTAIKNSLDHRIITMGENEKEDYVVDFDDVRNLRDIVNVLKGTGIDGVIHCAGEALIMPNDILTANEISRLMNVNAISNFIINRGLITCDHPPKFILHVCSDAADHPMTHSLAYNMSKAAQLMLMKQMAREQAPRPVIFAISPGKIAGTAMSDYVDATFPALRGMTKEEGRKYLLSGLRVGEMHVQSVAAIITSLIDIALSDDGSCLHGHNIMLGGAR